MAWETRRNGTSYYYTKRRVGKRVISEYHGKGEIAELIEAVVLEGKSERELKKQDCLEHEQIKSALNALLTQMNKLIREQMVADGYKYHKGQWRKRTGQE